MIGLRSIACGLLAALGFGLPASAVCLDDPGICQIEGGEYHMLAPAEMGDTPAPVLMFLHGFSSHGGNTIGNRALTEPALARGYVVIAPTGSPRQNGRGARWLFHPDFDQTRDEFVFLQAVIADAAERLPIDRDHVVLGGFSGGAFMTSYMACQEPDAFYAYAPLAGGFWRPHPELCDAPVRLLQTHGWADGTVPLEGRPLSAGRYLQGDIFATLEIWRRTNGCDQMRADLREASGEYWRRDWTHCQDGSALSFVLFPGGHTMPPWWTPLMLDWVESLPAPQN